ncbi:M23 family metallopeptidase [Acidaminococcus sp. NSJ-142]|uniref:M23 family metallopeptidase n=1 Tax=Acidaminococcus TaxID=904 RepID=UPI001E549CA7|nr:MULTISPECIES: M23 family metallopeptidase [Acidaminococcus]MCD2434501.1 M23 family metallopeptidase [Acidaminococcus hominis]
MEQSKSKEKLAKLGSYFSGLLPKGHFLDAGLSLEWKDENGEVREFHGGTKLIFGFAGVFLVCLMGLAVCGGLLVRAWDEQLELANYRADYGVYTERMAKLMDNNEKLQKELGQVVQLEDAVRKKLAQDGVKIGEETVDQKSKELDNGGQGGSTTADQLSVLEVQDEINRKRLGYKKENLTNMLLALSYSGDGTYGWPLSGGEISSFYGMRADPFGKGSDYHPGIDIAADYGTPVRASATGVVQEAQWNGGYGRFVSIDHGNGMLTCYGHMSAIAVTPGQHVKRGDVIGYVGSSGYSTGPHLHFEMRQNGNTVNPLNYARPVR